MSTFTAPQAPGPPEWCGPPSPPQADPGDTERAGRRDDVPARHERPPTRAVAAELRLDLDLPAARPAARHPWRRVAVAVAGVLGLLAGAGWRGGHAPAAPPPVQVVAIVALRAVVLTPSPSAELELSLTNGGDQSVIADTATVDSGGLAATVVGLGVELPSQGQAVLTDLTVPLRCGPTDQAGTAVRMLVRLRPATSGPPVPAATVTVVPVAPLSSSDGVCAAARASLPQGWNRLARALRFRTAGQLVDVNVADLPAAGTAVVAASVDGIRLTLPGGPAAIDAGSAHLLLRQPTGCVRGDQRIVPTGLQVLVQEHQAVVVAYLPIGADLATWWLDSMAVGCPSSPAGASVVRTGSAG